MLVAVGLAAALALTSPAGARQAPKGGGVDLDALAAWRASHGARILAEFAELLAIPNVASDSENIRRNAEHLRRALERRGVRAELLTLDGAPPLVWGRLEAPGAKRTLGIYVHYDGQPVDPAEWRQPAWQPTLYTAALEAGGTPRPLPEPGEPIDPEWRLYARSAGDDKAPVAAITAALDFLAGAGAAPTSNLVFLFEGEEEAGSDHLGAYFDAYRERLEVDLWLICDGPVHQSRRPQLVFGVRGYTGLDLTVYGATRYLHSGHYGNWAPNPALDLARLLAGLKDADGRVRVAGFYDGTVAAGEAERRAIAALPDIDSALRRELGLAATEAGNAPLAERLMLPSLNLRGLASAAVGEAARNVIPIEAHASIDIRLARGNDPAAILDRVEEHLAREGWTIVREVPDHTTRLAHPKLVRVERLEGYPAARTALDHPAAAPVVEAAQRAARGELLLVPTMGGSLPLYLFVEKLEAPLVIVPIANHDNNQHAPNENLRLANLWFGVDLFASLFSMP